MSDHAMLSPSGATRWMACPPSARLEEFFEDSGSDFAREGTLAHALAELGLKAFFEIIDNDDAREQDSELKLDPMYGPTMQDYVDEYITFVIEEYEKSKKEDGGAVLFIERKLDLTAYIPESYGTGDAMIVSKNRLKIIDLKYGQGVRVSCENNKQMMLYGLGAFKDLEFMYDQIDIVEMTIYQPRMSNISTFEMPVSELLNWAETELKPKAKMAFDGAGEFSAGKHCVFCKAKTTCKALAEENLKLARFEFVDSFLLSDAEISEILDRADLFKNWINAVEDFAFKSALNGKKWPGYKLVQGRSNRKFTDETKIVEVLTDNFYTEEQIFKKSLRSLTELEKTLSKKKFEDLFSGLIYKPPGSPTLVPVTDKRSEYVLKADAADDFSDFIETE